MHPKSTWFITGAVALVLAVSVIWLGSGEPYLQLLSLPAFSARTPPPLRRQELPSLYVFRSHVVNEVYMARYEQMRTDLGGDVVYMLFDDTTTTTNGTRIHGKSWAPGNHVLLFNAAECLEVSPLHTGQMVDLLQTPMAMVGKYFEQVAYRHIWFLENDILCNGNYASCLDAPLPCYEADFLSTYVTNYWSFKEWGRWHEMTGELAALPLEQRWKSFFPLVRISKRLLRVLHGDLQRSSGLCEVYVPTLCMTSPLISNCSLANLPLERVGDFTAWGTAIYPKATLDDKLYHPVKA